MITFDINGATVDFDEKMDNYNNIRKLFKTHAIETANEFEDRCLSIIQDIKLNPDLILNIGNELIDEILRRSIECIISYGVITVDLSTFKDIYCNKYLEFSRLYNNFKRELVPHNRSKKNNFVLKLHDIDIKIKQLSKFIYYDCFNIHYAVIDVLIENKVPNIELYIDDEGIKKSNALFNNYKDGFIITPDQYNVVKQIITLNPYRKDVYEFLIKEDGDFSKGVENLTDYLGYEIKPYKDQLINDYIRNLINDDIINIELAKEKVTKYCKYIGTDDSAIYVARIDAIYTFENA